MTNVKELIKKQLKTIKGDFVIFTSGGIDSCSIKAKSVVTAYNILARQ
tara:strand:+ start:466 stop:609 length:144 start_codon:yes stop_codon:yes gene_type:complete